MLERTPKNLLDNKVIKPVNLKGNQPWKFFGRTDAEVEAPILSSHLIWRGDSLEKHPEAGKDRRQKEKGATEDKLVG